MGSPTKGDIVLFPFPYTDLSNRKMRPCLVLSDLMKKEVILCQITSQKTQRDDFTIGLKRTETMFGSLQIDSYIRCNMLFTAKTSLIQKKICCISSEKYSKITQLITKMIKK